MNLHKQFRIYYTKIITSIAFIPGVVAISFLFLSWGMLEIDFSEFGKNIKSSIAWLSLKDASTARTVIATVAAAILSLTVFSFSMVMIVLNQAASQMSNRVLNSMIQNRFQQIILGFYIGTIVYALFLLSTIRDISSGIYIPSLSIYLLIILTVIDIFLFIYFLDYVTQTVKYETIINRIEKKTLNTISETFKTEEVLLLQTDNLHFVTIKAPVSNYFQGFNEQVLKEIAEEKNIYFHFLYKRNTYVLEGNNLLKIYFTDPVDKETLERIVNSIDFYKGQPIDRNADYGFMQLAEVAIKALSPGINDPATAVISLNSLTNALAQRMYTSMPSIIKDSAGNSRIYCPSSGFEEIFKDCIIPIWNYGKNDQYIQDGIYFSINQLKERDIQNKYTSLFDHFLDEIRKKRNS